MKTGSFFGMVLATAVLGGSAYFVIQKRDSATAASETNTALLPSLAAAINDVAALTIESTEGSYTLDHDKGAWSLADRGGFPADATMARKLLFALRDATILEEKTADAAKYSRLGVEDIDAADAQSTRLTVKDASGTDITSVIIGNRRAAKGGSRSTEYYVRRAGEAPSWLVKGDFSVDKDPKAWLDKDVLDVARERIRAALIEHADGERVMVSKADKTATDFEVHDIPDGQELKYASIAGTLSSALARLTLDDVVPDAEVEFPDQPLATCTFWTFDGLKVVVKTHAADEKFYARIETAFDAADPPGLPPLPVEPEPGEDEESTAAVVTPPAPEGPTPEEVQAEALELNAKLESWTYVLPSWKKSTFVKRMSDLAKDIEIPETIAAPAPEPGVVAPPGGALEVPELPEAGHDHGHPSSAPTPEDTDSDDTDSPPAQPQDVDPAPEPEQPPLVPIPVDTDDDDS